MRQFCTPDLCWAPPAAAPRSVLTRPGCDVIHLATVVAGHSYIDWGYALLQQYCMQAARAMVEVRQQVLVRGRGAASSERQCFGQSWAQEGLRLEGVGLHPEARKSPGV